MRTPIRTGLITAAALCLVAALSCGKNEQEAQKFNRASDETFKRDMSELTSFKLANGITVYLQEERTDNQVAIEAIYRAGYTRDTKGKFQIAHLTEHMAMHCGSGPYKTGELMSKVKDGKGMIAAEAVSDFIHVDYVVDASRVDETLAIEAARLTSLTCDQQTLEEQARDVVGEFKKSLESDTGSLSRVAVGVLTHVLFYGETHLPMQANVAKLTLDDVRAFHDAYYRPDDMCLVLIGNFKKPDVEALVRKHFESIPSRPAPPEREVVVKRSMRATWDVPVQMTFLVAPGPYNDPKERLILTMFGTFLQTTLVRSPDVYNNSQAVLTSNQSYTVARLPFFMWTQAKQGLTTDTVVPVLFGQLDQCIQALDDDRTVDLIKTNMISFVTSSGLQADEPDYPMMHFQVIGQEALNVCLKHMLLEGRTPEQFADEINNVTPDEFRAVVKKHLDRKNFININVEPRA
ncbi:MAG TPA: pitrilysin family protein [Candidatus Krumholzibacteria bacterium]